MLNKEAHLKPLVTDPYPLEYRWRHVWDIIRKLINQESINNLEWQDLFYDLHMICLWDEQGCQKVYTCLKRQISDLFIDKVMERLRSIEDGQQQLKEYIDYWTEFRGHCCRFPLAFQQLDLALKNCGHSNAKSNSIVRIMMLKLWKEHVVVALGQRLQNTAMELILEERNGHIIESRLILGLRQSFLDLDDVDKNEDKYTPQFDSIYMVEIGTFYLQRANDYLKLNGVMPYITWALLRFDKEEHRAELYFESSPKVIKRVKETCTGVLVKNFAEQILAECTTYIKVNDTASMRTIFLFLDKVPGFELRFLQQFGSHVVTTGCSYLLSPAKNCNCEIYVQKLIECYAQFDDIVKSTFHDDQRARITLNKAYDFIINDTRIFQGSCNPATKTSAELRSPEMLANYCDLLLRRTTISRKLSEEDLNEKLDQMIHIIKFIKNKDAFIKYHKMHLTKRLILDATIDSEKEEQFAQKLKDLPGIPMEYTNKLMRMFKDLKSSEEILMQYRKSLQPMYNMESVNNNNNNNNNDTIQDLTTQLGKNLTTQDNNNGTSYPNSDIIDVKILNPSAWTQANDKFSIQLPNEITSSIPSFEAFYNDQFSGRKLEWCHQLSNGTITFATEKGKFDIAVTASQLAVLMAYNDQVKGEKTMEELESFSNLDTVELKRTLWSLVSNPKLKIQLMNCDPQLTTIKELDRETNKYSINQDFALIKNGKPQYKGRFNLIGRLQI